MIRPSVGVAIFIFTTISSTVGRLTPIDVDDNVLSNGYIKIKNVVLCSKPKTKDKLSKKFRLRSDLSRGLPPASILQFVALELMRSFGG